MNSEYFQRWYRHTGPLPIYPKECSDAVLTLLLSLGLGWVNQIRSDQHKDLLDLALETASGSSCVQDMQGYKYKRLQRSLSHAGRSCLIVSTECTGAPGRLMHPWRFFARIKRQDP